MTRCPSCFAEVSVSPCPYCDTTVSLSGLVEKMNENKTNNLLFDFDFKTKNFNFKDFISKYVTSHELSSIINGFVTNEDNINEIKDTIYEQLPVSVIDEQSLGAVLEKVKSKIASSNHFLDLVALASLIRYGLELIVTGEEKKYAIHLGEGPFSFRERVNNLFGNHIRFDMVKHWRNLSAIIHHDNTSDLYDASFEVKLAVLREAYFFIDSFQ